MEIVWVLIALAIACAVIWYRLSRKRGTEKATAYICSRCGQRDCICDRVDEAEPTDKRSG